MPTLEELRARLANDTKRENNTQSDSAVYQFWNIPEGESAVIRFLPDGNPDADYFWVQRMVIKLPFPYVKGHNDGKAVTVQVPCLDMWPDTRGKDPILTETKSWWDHEDLKELARRYYKKRSYIFQGLVVENPIQEDKEIERENPIRRLVINPTIFEIIKSSLMNPEIEEIPTDYERGRDFRIKRTKRGQYSDYSTSSWSMKERALNDTERAAVEQHGLYNLNDFLPQKPTEEHIAAIKEMFKASLDEQPYDPDLWKDFYRPYGYDFGSSNQQGGQISESLLKRAQAENRAAAATEEDSPEKIESALSRLRSRAEDKEESEPVAKTETVEKTEEAKEPKSADSARAILDLVRQRNNG